MKKIFTAICLLVSLSVQAAQMGAALGVYSGSVTINGTYKLFEETGIVQKHQSFDVTFHEMIDVAAMDRSEYAALPEKVRDIIASAL